MLIKTQQKKKREEALRIQNTNAEENLDANQRASITISSMGNSQTNAFNNTRKYQNIETSKKQ